MSVEPHGRTRAEGSVGKLPLAETEPQRWRRGIGLACLILLLVPSSTTAQDEAPGVEDEAITIFEVAPGAPQDANAAGLADELRPLMNLELGFIKRVCKPTAEQKAKIAAAADVCLKKVAVAVQQDPAAPRRGAFGMGQHAIVAVAANGEQLTGDPIQQIQQEMLKAVRPLVSEQQHAAYVEESKQRREFKRRSVVRVTVELLDRQLALTEKQRTSIAERLVEHWTGAESVPIQMYLSNPQYLPEIPEVLVQAELDPEQKPIWRSIHRTTFPLYLSQIADGAWVEGFLE